MCGIAGIVGTGPVNQRLYDALTVLQHRGLTLVMSNVILDYLARTTGKFEAASVKRIVDEELAAPAPKS